MKSKINIDLFEYETYKGNEIIDLRLINFDLFDIKYHNGRNHLKAKQYVGVAQFGDLRVSVLPKIYSGQSNINSQKEAINNFLYMLSFVNNIDNIKYFDSDNNFQKNNILEILVYLFASKLFTTLKKKIAKNYVVIDDESYFLKGKWRLSEQLKTIPHIKHKFLVSYDEFTENNFMNQVFKFVCKFLMYYIEDNKTINLLRNIELIFCDVDDISFPNLTLVDKVIFNRTNSEFKFPFELAKIFLKKLSLDLNDRKHQNYVFMFDMNLLFEQYIAKSMQNALRNRKSYHLEIQKANRNLLISQDDSRKTLLKPDVLIKKDNELLIIDTKYKDMELKEISPSDIYQLFAYSQVYKSERVALLYPGEKDTEVYKYNVDGDYNLEIWNINIKRNLKDEQAQLESELLELIESKN